MKNLFTKLFIISILFLGFTAYAQAAEYYISTTGNDSNNGLTEANAWATFAYADSQLQPGDSVIVLDGTYNQRLNPTTSGTDGNYITWRAQHDYQVELKPTSGTGATLRVFSCPDCGTPVSVKHHLIFEGFIVRGYGEDAALNLFSGDNTPEANQTNNIIVRRCGFYGNAQETNTSVISTGPGYRDSLMEDIFAYGRGRKAAEIFSSLRVTIRRAVMRYDYWEGDDYKPGDPRVCFTGYNVHDSIFENILAIDSAPTPAGYSADRSGIAIEGNPTPGGFSNSQNNKYLGSVVLNTYGNGVESDSGSDTPNRDIFFENVLIWNTHDEGEGLDIHGNDDQGNYTWMTVGNNERSGIVVNQYPGNPITNETLSNIYSTNNGLKGFHYGAGQVASFINSTTHNNGEGDEVEVSYAPDLSTRFLDPTMVAGHERGATIVNRYVDGVLTNTPLWPWPDEDIIKQHMCNPADLALVHRSDPNDSMFVGYADWCQGNKTLTEYIWEANGATCPADICNYGATEIRADVDQNGTVNTTDAMLTLRNSLGLDMSGTNWHASATTGDVNCQDGANSTDAMLILRKSLGLDMAGTGWCVN